MRYAARLVALAVATLLGCVLLFDLYFLGVSYLDYGHVFPPWMGMQDFIGIGVLVLVFLASCLLFRFFGRKPDRVKRTTALVMGLLALAYVGYTYRFQFAARVWHWRHGNSVVLARYEIPVPSHWLLLERDRTSVELSDTKTGCIVNIIAPNPAPGDPRLDLNSWASSLQQTLGREGVRFDVQRSLPMGDETVLCLGVRVSELKLPPVGIPGLMCTSSRGLSLTFIGPQSDFQQFDALVRGIRRK